MSKTEPTQRAWDLTCDVMAVLDIDSSPRKLVEVLDAALTAVRAEALENYAENKITFQSAGRIVEDMRAEAASIREAGAA